MKCLNLEFNQNISKFWNIKEISTKTKSISWLTLYFNKLDFSKKRSDTLDFISQSDAS